MIRRTFRAGVLLGLVAGAAGAVKKAMDARKEGAPAGAGGGPGAADWPPMPGAEPVTVPAPPAPEQSDVVPDAAPTAEVHDGEEAEEHFADADRQPDVPTPDWNPADLQEGPAGPPPAGPAKRKAPAKKKAAAKKTAARKAPTEAWVEPEADGTCPASHPIKAKLSSKIFHLPGGFNYPRTRPDRCYIDAAAAEADGLRPAKR
jgi:hypothetical protein